MEAFREHYSLYLLLFVALIPFFNHEMDNYEVLVLFLFPIFHHIPNNTSPILKIITMDVNFQVIIISASRDFANACILYYSEDKHTRPYELN